MQAYKEPKSILAKSTFQSCHKNEDQVKLVVTDINHLVLLLSIQQMWNLERNIMGSEAKSILIIIQYGFKHIKKRVMDYRLYTLLGAGLACVFLFLGPGKGCIGFCSGLHP